MLKKIYAAIIKFIKENKLFLIIWLILLLVFLVKLPYTVMMPGGTTNLNNRYEIENSNKVKGSFNMSYVSEAKASIFSFIVSKINPYWDAEKISNVTYENESYEDMMKREKLMYQESIDVAKYVALKEANYDVAIDEEKIYVSYISNNAKTSLNVDDQIISINDTIINNVNELRTYINNCKEGDIINIIVYRNKKYVETNAEILLDNDHLVIGIVPITNYSIKSDVDIKFKARNKELGPSGGLMNTLAIYNLLTKKDLTNGLKVVGTGTIDIDGNVGAIGGIKYKLIGAKKKKCDVYLVPVDNYEEAKKVNKKYNLKLKLIKVSNIKDAINELEKLS